MTKNLDKKEFYLLGIFFILVWLPFYLAFFPGVGMHDEIYASIHPFQSANQPIMYNILLSLFYKAGLFFDSHIGGTGAFIFIAMSLTAFAIAFVLIWLNKKNISKIVLTILVIYYAFTPIIIDYSIAAVKDRAFAVIFLLMIPVLYEITRADFKFENKNLWLFFFILSLLMIWVRNNGSYIFIAMVIFVFIMMKESKKIFLKAAISILFLGMLPGFICGKNFTEAVGVPLQQICRVVALNKEIPEGERNYIKNFMPLETIKMQYNERTVDLIKWNPDYNRKFVDNNKFAFAKTWFVLLKMYPRDYFDAWVFNTQGFWGYLPWGESQSKFGYAYDDEIYLASNKVGMADGFKVSQNSILPDGIKSVLGKYVWNYSIFIPSGICLWLTIAISFILALQKKYAYIFVLLPAILCSLTLVVSAPVANCFRYTFYYVLCLPIYLLLPFMLRKE